MNVYVLIAIDDDYRVRECVVVSELEKAQELFAKLREIWGGDKVCMASRAVDEIPENLIGEVVTVPFPPIEFSPVDGRPLHDYESVFFNAHRMPPKEKCYQCGQMKRYSGEFCDDCAEANKNEGPEVLY